MTNNVLEVGSVGAGTASLPCWQACWLLSVSMEVGLLPACGGVGHVWPACCAYLRGRLVFRLGEHEEVTSTAVR